MRYALETLCNLCIHHVNRKKIFDNAGIDILVNLHSDVDPHIREVSMQIIDHLEDITPVEVLARVKQNIGLSRMVELASHSDPIVRAVAAEAIGEEVWRDNKQQEVALREGAVETLVALCANADEAIESLLPALWSLRNLIQANSEAKKNFGLENGIQIVLEVMTRVFTGRFLEQSERVLEVLRH